MPAAIRELAQAWGLPSARRQYAGSNAVDTDNGMTIATPQLTLTPKHGARTFDVHRDLASLVCGRSAVTLAIRLRWLAIASAVLGATTPVMLIFAVQWANGGLGQFALAYPWPVWLEVWMCVGWWLSVCVLLLWYASMQREIAWMALREIPTLWVILMTGIFVAGLISLFEFGVHLGTWIALPVYVGCALAFPLVAMADALPPKLRLTALRFAGPFVLGCAGTVALVLRLPMAQGTPGMLVWTVMGTSTVTNLQALTYSATVATVLLAQGVLLAWLFPGELAFITTSVQLVERAARTYVQEGPREASLATPTVTAGVSLPVTLGPIVSPHQFDSIEDMSDTVTPSLCARCALSMEESGTDLEARHYAVAAVERPDGVQTHHSLCELVLQSTQDVRLAVADSSDPPSARQLGSDASVGTGVDADNGAGAPATRCAVPSGFTIELTPQHGTRTFDVHRDLASLVCGRSAVTLAIRLRWPCVTIGAVGAAAPVLLIFAVHWANGGLGQFALAYPWPVWLEVWYCVGWWLFVCVLLLWYASMQREIAWMALQQASTLWIIAITGVWVAGWVSVYEFGMNRSTWVSLPTYILCALFFPLIAMADALPPKLRLPVLRFAAPFSLGCSGIVAVGLRLPTATDTPGELVWTLLGTDTITNLQAIAYSSTVLAALLAEGILRAWLLPTESAFIQTSVRIAVHASGSPDHSAPEGPSAAAAATASASASVAPYPLGLHALDR
jgi:hypothetical protein